MIWISIGAAMVIVVSAASLWASRDSRRDLATGQPTFESVADLTGIWSRQRLDGLLGTRDADDRYRADTEQVRKIPRSAGKLWLDSEFSDMACIVVALAAPILYDSSAVGAISLLGAAAAYLLLGYAWAICVVARSGVGRDEQQPNNSESL